MDDTEFVGAVMAKEAFVRLELVVANIDPDRLVPAPHEPTHVTFRPLTPRDLAAYVAGGEWEGRAGGYAVQGRGAALVEAVDGDFWNVVGLPVAELLKIAPELLL